MIAPEQFVLEIFADGAILLDLESGLLFELNATAAFVWKHGLEGTDRTELAALLVQRFGLPQDVAVRDVDAALALPATYPTPAPPSDYQYHQVEGAYRIFAGVIPILELDLHTLRLQTLSGFDPFQTVMYLRAVAPKLVALFGTSILHAAAVASPSGTVCAFLGDSGAGKTTSARTFAQAQPGSTLVCEDKLVMRPQDGRLAAVLGGETRVSDWINAAREALTTGREPSVDASPLGKVGLGAAKPITDVLLLNAQRRQGSSIELRPLTPTQAARNIFHSGFYGSAASSEWRRQLHCTATLARTTRTSEATMPAGVNALAKAAERYTDMTAS